MSDSARVTIEAFSLLGIVVVNAATVLICWLKLREQTKKQTEKISSEVRAGFVGINGLLRRYIEAMPFAAWIKLEHRKDDGRVELRMQFVNSQYTSLFGVATMSYEGRTDFEVWPRDVANDFYAHDLQVLGSGNAAKTSEKVTLPDGTPAVLTVLKFPIDKEGYRGVCGLVLKVEVVADV
jgi:PAS domain-containing protein